VDPQSLSGTLLGISAKRLEDEKGEGKKKFVFSSDPARGGRASAAPKRSGGREAALTSVFMS